MHRTAGLGKIGPLFTSFPQEQVIHESRHPFYPQRYNPGLKPLVVLLTALMALLFCLRNPLFHGMAPGFDASLFAVMGKMWSEGACSTGT